MKKPSKKFIIAQLIIVAIILLPMAYSLLMDWYLGQHVLHSCLIGKIAPEACFHTSSNFIYDTTLATWLGYIEEFYFPVDSFMRDVQFFWHDFWGFIYEAPYNILLLFYEKSRMVGIVGSMLLIPFWLVVVNLLYFSVRRFKKLIVKN